MDAGLSRLLARAVQSPNYRVEGASFIALQGLQLGNQSLADWLIEQAIAAYSVEKLPPLIQGFLQDCDRSSQIEYDLFGAKRTGTQAERDQQVMEKLAEEQAE